MTFSLNIIFKSNKRFIYIKLYFFQDSKKRTDLFSNFNEIKKKASYKIIISIY